MSHKEHFWLESPEDLVRSLTLTPHHGDSLERKLNAISRLLIVFVVILAVLKWRNWEWVLIGGLAIIVYVYLTNQEHCLIENFNEDVTSPNLKYYQQVPLSSLYTYECAAGIPEDEVQVDIPSEPEPIKPKPRKTAQEEERASWSVLKTQKATLDTKNRQNLMRALF